VLARLREEIGRNGGWISFARYMELVLYEPGLGYYAGAMPKFGAAGDFVTAPELGSLFGRTLARQIEALPYPVLEIGAGSGALAETLIAELGCPYLVLETSGELRARQEARLRGAARWLADVPHAFRGVVVANEVLDAIPVHAVAWREGGVFERGVTVQAGRLHWSERPATGELLAAAREIDAVPPYVSEIGLQARAWVRSLAERLASGVVLVFDYGFPAAEYYHPQRSAGTLMCHFRHTTHADVFARPGLEDITAHVDFSAAARAAHGGGLRVLGYATQAQFLVNCGITDVLALDHRPQTAAEAQTLLSPAEMGELFKALALGTADFAGRRLLGFSRHDRSHTL